MMTNDEAREVSRIARRDIMRNGIRIEGLPKFPHVLHTIMVILTAGLWLPVYAICYQFSARRKFMERRNSAMLRQAQVNIESRRVYA